MDYISYTTLLITTIAQTNISACTMTVNILNFSSKELCVCGTFYKENNRVLTTKL